MFNWGLLQKYISKSVNFWGGSQAVSAPVVIGEITLNSHIATALSLNSHLAKEISLVSHID